MTEKNFTQYAQEFKVGRLKSIWYSFRNVVRYAGPLVTGEMVAVPIDREVYEARVAWLESMQTPPFEQGDASEITERALRHAILCHGDMVDYAKFYGIDVDLIFNHNGHDLGWDALSNTQESNWRGLPLNVSAETKK